MFLRKFWQQDPNFKREFPAILGTVFCESVNLRLLSNGEGVRDIQHSMSIVPDTRFHV